MLGPPLSHAAGRRQASLGTPVPRMPTNYDQEVILEQPTSNITPNLAHTSSHGQRRIFLLPRQSDQTRHPGYKISSTMVKQVQQHRPNVPTNLDRSCTYLVLRAHSDEHYIQLKPTLKFPRGGAASGSVLDQHSEEHWPGGLIKMTLGLRKPKGKRG